jgi:PKD repeat protein
VVSSSLPTCLTDTADFPADTCTITGLTDDSVSMTWTVTPVSPYCTISADDDCIYSFQSVFDMSLQGTNTFTVSGSCPGAVAGGTFTVGSADIALMDADPLTCSATWTWDRASEFPQQVFLGMTEITGQGLLETPDQDHTFGANLAPPGPYAAFTSAAGSGQGAYTFTDASYSLVPHVGITEENWTSSDGGDGTGATWDHTFDKDGKYDVTLEVTDSNGNTDSVTHQVSVTSAVSRRSSASITIKEKLSPAKDAGRFDLMAGNKKVKSKAGNGDHGAVQVKAGTYLVRQLAKTVALSHYAVRMRCTKNGHQDLSASASAGAVKLAAGDAVVCTFNDTRTSVSHCDVPALAGKSKAAAKRALTKAHCRLGKVRSKAAGRSPVVEASSPAAYAVRKKGTKVSLVLGKH